MIKTENGTIEYENLVCKDINTIGIKFNYNILGVLEERIKEAKNTGKRGVSLLLYGDIKRMVSVCESAKGRECKLSFHGNGNITVADWKPELAYNGKQTFWIEAFLINEV